MAAMIFLAALGIPALILACTALGGGRDVLRRKGVRLWRWWEHAILFVIIFSLTGSVTEAGLPFTVIGALAAAARSLQLLWWGWRAGKPAAERPAHLAEASSGRLLGAGFGLLVLTAALAASGISSGLSYAYSNGWARRSFENNTHAQLDSIRRALDAHRGDSGNQGRPPADFSALTEGGKYLKAVPHAQTPFYHDPSGAVRYGKDSDDSGGWLYDPDPGRVSVNCTHTDSKGKAWTEY